MQTPLHDFYNRLLVATAKPHEPWKQNMVRGGSSGFYNNGLVVGDQHACPRRAYLRSKGVEEVPDLQSLLTWEVGYAWERLYAKQGMLRDDVDEWQVDKTVTMPIYGTNRSFSGRPDHVVTLKTGNLVVIETKSISSHNTYRKVIADGEYPAQYLAQLVAYMDAMGITDGILAIGAFIWAGKARGQKIKPTVRHFAVNIIGDDILVDGQPVVHTVQDQRDHRLLLGCVLDTGLFGRERMVTPSACAFCPLSNGACAKYDSGEIESTDAFIREAQDDFSRTDPTEGSETADTAVL